MRRRRVLAGWFGCRRRRNSDQFHFVYQVLEGNTDLTVQVLSVFAAGASATPGS
jgi:hypothetical protein